MGISSTCCTTPPVAATYEKKGEVEDHDGLVCYSVGPTDSRCGVIFVYDVFGNHANAYHFADKLGEAGYRVILPDFLRNEELPLSALSDIQNFVDYFAGRGSWETNRAAFVKAREVLRKSGVEEIAVIGFCWGAMIAMDAMGESDTLVGGALIHPSALATSHFEEARAPVLLLPAGDDRDFAEDFEIARAKPFGAKSVHVRFDDVHHGFCAARGDWTDEVQARRAMEAVELSVKFFGSVFSKD